VALNCVANGRILRERVFDRMWIQPAAGDDGGALGAALFVWHQLLGKERAPKPGDAQRGSLLGPGFSSAEVRAALDRAGARYHHFDTEEVLVRTIAKAIASGKVVGHVQGRMEFGPRALGGRSILGDARSPAMQSQMNLKIKFRESFRPFAPAVLAADARAWFSLDGHESPYMLFVAEVKKEHRLPIDGDGKRGLELLALQRSTIPAVTHVDFSARVQTVDGERSPRFSRLLEALRAETGCPVVINTSFNVRGEPIVCTPEDAYRCFLGCHMDVLVVEDCILYREEQEATDSARIDDHVRQFQLD
jgi:carbamoyltransferase